MINTFETDRGVSVMDDRKILIKDFADHWRGKGYAKGNIQQFWIQALNSIGYH